MTTTGSTPLLRRKEERKKTFTFSIVQTVAATTIIGLIIASNAGYAYASVAKVDELNQQLEDRIQLITSQRHQRFTSSGSQPPLDSLFTMQKNRRENLGSQISELLVQARMHSEMKKKVEEELMAELSPPQSPRQQTEDTK